MVVPSLLVGCGGTDTPKVQKGPTVEAPKDAPQVKPEGKTKAGSNAATSLPD